MKNSKDLDLIELNNTIKINISRLSEVKKANELINSNFNDKVEKEYQEINLLKFDNEDYKSEKLTRLQSEVNELIKLISTENWTNKKINSTNLNKFLSEIEILNNSRKNIFQTKTIYFHMNLQMVSVLQ